MWATEANPFPRRSPRVLPGRRAGETRAPKHPRRGGVDAPTLQERQDNTGIPAGFLCYKNSLAKRGSL